MRRRNRRRKISDHFRLRYKQNHLQADLLTIHGRCAYCDRPMAQGEITVDHVIPVYRGGLDTPENMVPCCRTCNESKGSMLPAAFMLECDYNFHEFQQKRRKMGKPKNMFKGVRLLSPVAAELRKATEAVSA